MSINTVRKYVQLLEKKCLIKTEWTMVNTKDGRAHNGSLKYTILPIQEAIDYYDRIQMQNLRAEASKVRAEQALKRYDKKHRKKAIIRTKTRTRLQIPKPTKRTKFEANKGKTRRPGTGSIKKVAINTWQGRYAPTVNGKRIIRHIYANSLEECEQKLSELIAQMKEEYKLV